MPASTAPKKSKRKPARPSPKAVELPSPEAYGEFIQQIDIVNVVLLECEAKRIGRPDLDGKLSYAIESGPATFEASEQGFCVQTGYTIQLLHKVGAEDESAFAHIQLVFECSYRSGQPMKDSIFAVFKDLNVPTNVWPYARELVQSLSNRFGFPTLVLPAFKV